MEESFSKEESLALISKMINAAKKEQKDNGMGWIVWGWWLFTVSILTVFNMRYHWFQTSLFWNLFGGIVLLYMLFSIIRAQFFKRIEKVTTYTRDLCSKLNAGFFICLAFIIVSMNVNVENNPAVYHTKGFALLINLYAFWILIYGTALSFRPSVIASFVVWGIGFACLMIKSFETIMILHAVAVLAGYIIPGYIANSQFKKLHQKDTDGV